MTSTIKVDNIQDQDGNNIINENANTITIGASGDTVTLASGASQTGFGRTGTVDWDTTPKTATFTAVSGDGFFANTSDSAFTMNLPAGTAGSIVSVADYAGTWQTNNLTVSPNGSQKIGGINANVVLNTEGQSVTFIYVDDVQGWVNVQDSTSNERGENFITATGGTVTCSGNFKIHTFTGPGTFCVSQIATTPANNEVSYIVVAGGGGGGSGDLAPSVPSRAGGGGGAGGFRESKSGVDCYSASPLEGATNISVTATGFPITVGGGGAKGPVGGSDGTNGANSVFSTVTSAGGGGGDSAHTPNPATSGGLNGGSGGGGSSGGGPSGQAGSGNTPPVSPPQGNNGGGGGTNPGMGGDGGGGATAVGSTAPNNPNTAGAAGGAGATTSINASPTTYAGGGGGGGGVGAGGAGGSGGGGTGGNQTPPLSAGQNGTANTGGGAGGGAASGGSNHCAGAGGSGVVIIRYKFQ